MPASRPLPALLCTLALSIGAGCRSEPAAPPTAPADETTDAARAMPPEALAETPAAGAIAAEGDPPVLRVERGALVIGETRIALDGFTAPTRGAAGYLIEPLFDVLQALSDDRRAAAARDPDGDASQAGRLVLSIAPDVPYRLVAPAVYTAGQAQLDHMAARVRTPDGPRLLTIEVPKIRAALAGEMGGRGTGGAPGSSAETTVHAPGVRVIAREGTVGGGLFLLAQRAPTKPFVAMAGAGAADAKPLRPSAAGGQRGVGLTRKLKTDTGRGAVVEALEALEPPAASPTPADWGDALMVPRDGVCPSVPRAAGRVDRPALETLLGAVYAIEPGCTSATLGADPDVPWQDVADALQVHRAMEHAVVLTGSAAQTDPSDCAGARVPPRRAP